MKVTAIEIAEAIEKEISQYLQEASGRVDLRFTRFIDLGGKQLEIYVYPPVSGASVWCIVGIKSVYRDEQGDCMVYSASLPGSDRRFEYVQVSPAASDLPEIAKKVLEFLKEDLKGVNEGTALEGGGGFALGSKDGAAAEEPSEDSAEPVEEVGDESPADNTSDSEDEPDDSAAKADGN